MTRLLLVLPLLALPLLALAACEPVPQEASGEGVPNASGPPLLGTGWRLETLDGAAPDSIPGGRSLITVAFTEQPWDDGARGALALGGYDGCNDFGMAYRMDGDPASGEGAAFRTSMVASNAMACGEPGTHISDRVHRGLGAARRLRLDGDRLSLLDSLGTERLAFVPRPQRSVDSTAVTTGLWRLDPSASDLPTAYGLAPARYEVAFGPDGTYRGRAGCVTFGGDYSLDNDRLSVSSYSRDDETCAPDARGWTGPYGLETAEIEADSARMVLRLRSGGRAVFVR